MRGARSERLAQELQHEIALILQREVSDPRVGFITVTRVELSKDLSQGKVFYSCLGSLADRALTHAALVSAGPYIHALIKKRFRLKIIPNVQFVFDPSIEGAIAISDTLDKLGGPSS